MKLLNKLERKFEKYAIPDFIRYVIFIYILGTVIGVLNPNLYWMYLQFDLNQILKGQVWRIFTFLLAPGGVSFYSPLSIIFFVFFIYAYLMIGRSLERAWGYFRFNLYFISGVLFNIIAALILHFGYNQPYGVGLEYVFQSMFFAFAVLFPEVRFLIFYIIPVKVKWLAILEGIFYIWSVIDFYQRGDYAYAIAIIMAVANFLIFFFATRNYKKISPKQQKRKIQYKRQVYQASIGPKHKCAVCGRTELDDENLEFRYCSKCNGNYEYCKDHLFTHEHVK
ncbi:rhomboid family protein [Anaeromicropila populeti]|uniref:Membrane associated serine protease, rhomboid family n=1 Tax=Anaeromicropila populeti TaxID=37658 RepID=A0A1I6KIY8_9FIRM|nr:hypothetical protein [Anaeromicropila populeti]SFR91203.1 hypothetical protein SAMN05661086_02457 [Anaeromicropila populeti]